ncbi:MAG: Single-stranded-DNA-specific exonuclease RecJ [candidate division WWE3 bacterium GW2011_GWA1_41_8]|uniref:Single-stranded-DNA-specific exonuclease RecJ n=2 Tax=Katanobacteria TaxID=422282 RepID=A0A0G0XA31_UNCKA|nr:MAG: Single-stranded-DNA-specific exonuclease RecJ [candidate division WWE3 bacterium GW2011_GWA1_41_8]
MKRWNIIHETNSAENILELLLKNRGITDPTEKKIFMNPPKALQCAKTFSQDFKKSLLKAKEIINSALKADIPVVIHGDYDADGISATAILFSTIKDELDYDKCYYFIPNRFDHGYGLSKSSVDAVVAMVTEELGKTPEDLLFITVDSGITAAAEVDYIRSLGYSVIITDHHQKPQVLPNADCIVWEDNIVGSGISWYLAKTLGSRNPQSIGLAALATVTDLQPLTGTNRSIVKEGLEVLNNIPSLGIKKLLDFSGRRNGEITTYDLGWVIGPRLNASGRLIDATDSLKLLIEKDEVKAEGYALALNKVNSDRQDKTVEMYEVASGVAVQAVPKVIFSSNEEYHEGIIGLVAAKLVQKYYRPSIVISLTDDYGKGSVRSIPGVDIISILRKYEELFVNLGGHPMAAGFTIQKSNIAVLQEKLTEYCEQEFAEELLQPVIDVDLKIPLNIINLEMTENVNRMKPFGIGNKEPTFLSERAGVASVDRVGRESNHLSMKLYGEGQLYKAIFFNGIESYPDLKPGDFIDIIYKVKVNEFNGNRKVDLIIEDLRLL